MSFGGKRMKKCFLCNKAPALGRIIIKSFHSSSKEICDCFFKELHICYKCYENYNINAYMTKAK